MNYWNMQLHPNDLGWTKERELLEKYHLIGLGDWEEAAKQQPDFEKTMAIGDYVLIKHGGNIIALTKVIGNYFYDENTNDLRWFQRCRKVEILDWYKNEYNYTVTSRKTLERYSNTNTEMYQSIKKWILIINNNKKMDNYISILTSNHNLILTGAPGTGKTYLAKQIAQQMIFGEVKGNMTEKEKEQFKQQCGFVQFHPSYDYTDFVEGLRPIEKNDTLGFERKDGVFKEFCKDAISLRKVFKDTYDEIASYIENGGEDLNTETKKFIVNDGNIRVRSKDNRSTDDEKKTVPIETLWQEYSYIARHLDEYDSEGAITKTACNEISEKIKLGIKDVGQYVVILLKELIKRSKQKIAAIPTGTSFVFIIDEINRGEISKIFGELFFSIDPGYRGVEGNVKTQYQNLVEKNDEFYDGFYVPENVYIIGTMNDIDRSVESMDFAFRRRFAFKEISAKDSQKMLDSDEAWGKDGKGDSKKPSEEVIMIIKEKMDNLNNLICPEKKNGDAEKGIEGLSSAYHIGASYFLKLTNYKKGDGTYDYDQLWDNHLEGLLLEYMRGMTDVPEKIKKLAIAFGYSKMEKYE